MELDSSETMKRFVKAGLGIAFLAAANCREEVAAGTLRTLPLAPEPMVRKLGLIYRKDKALSKAALGFIQVVLGHFGGQSGRRRGIAGCRRRSRPMMTCPRCYAEIRVRGRRVPRLRRAVAAERFGSDEDFGRHDIDGREKRDSTGRFRTCRRSLRQQLMRMTSSENSGTIVIADRAGKEQLTQVVARREAARGRVKRAGCRGALASSPCR